MTSRLPSSEDLVPSPDWRALSAVETPVSIVPTVLLRTGVADGFWSTGSAIGPVWIAFNPRGISAVRLAEDTDHFAALFQTRFGRRAFPCDPPLSLATAVERRLAGDRRGKLSFDLRGLTRFEQATLTKTAEIPRGEVRPYGWVAREIGSPGAARAVGTALAGNPIPLLIPCHRVIRGDGRIGDYYFGTQLKQRLLHEEGALADTPFPAGTRFQGSDTTRIFCFPTCRHARRATTRHRVLFRSTAEAFAAGYRPCLVCRPAVGG